VGARSLLRGADERALVGQQLTILSILPFDFLNSRVKPHYESFFLMHILGYFPYL
jgi:hypothetical protein